jgi:hypothetical protein
MGSTQMTERWRGNQYLMWILGLCVMSAMLSGCDISPIPTPIPGEEEGNEFSASGENFDDPYFRDENVGGESAEELPTETSGEGGDARIPIGDEAGDEMGAEEGGGEFVGGEDGENEEIDTSTTSDCDVVSAPDTEEELDAECDEEPESSFDVSPEDDDTLEGDAE